jgi:glycosyltransferase involved in cell wall biosynthesis
MAKGRPVITTPDSGKPESVSERDLVDYDDEVTLSERIKELIKDECLYVSVSKKNYERSKKYEASVLEQRRDAFYGELKNRCINR